MRTELPAVTPPPLTPPPASDPTPFLTQPWATVIGGICVVAAGLLAFAVAYYNRRQTEKHWRTTNRQERFSTIGTQLSDKSAAVRIAGVYAMEALIDDWLKPRPIPLPWYIFKPRTTWTKKDRAATRQKLSQRGTRQAQACINVLCAYLRLPPLKDRGTRPGNDTAGDQTKSTTPADNQVRTSITRTISAHLKENPPGESWSHLDYDLTGAQLHNADFNSTKFLRNALFAGAEFHGATTSFDGAEFHGERVSFDGAKFHGSTTSFNDAEFHGEVSFDGAGFHSKVTSFFRVEFHSEATSFFGAEFHGKRIWFDGAEFHSEWTWFDRAKFHGSTTSFDGAEFHGEKTSFFRVEFHSERVTFNGTEFHGATTSFDGAEFHGEWTSFFGVGFHGATTFFNRTEFHSATTSFGEAQIDSTSAYFDWDWPLTNGQHGPAPAKPSNVKPDEWPPAPRASPSPRPTVMTPGQSPT